jgi:hypothetical protein
MKHIPYGYKIVAGIAEVNEPNARQVKMLFARFLKGESLAIASKNCSLNFSHSQIGRMLENIAYCGGEFYPAIVSTEVFELVQEERLKRATKLGRLDKAKPKVLLDVPTKFKMSDCQHKYDNPFDQAEYIYSLIESEVNCDDE